MHLLVCGIAGHRGELIMATIVFISIYDRNANGLRLMSANLIKHGYQCQIIFLKRHENRQSYHLDHVDGEYPWLGIAKNGRPYKYAINSDISDLEFTLLQQTLERLRPDIIGLTVTTPMRKQAARVTRFIKRHFTVPVIWGGYDPTVNPADCLDLCDYACIGEGDHTILEIARRIDNGEALDDVKNLAFRKGEEIVVNPKYPLEQELDNFPWRDNSPQGKWLIDDNRAEENHPDLNDKPKNVYQAMSARGCPFHCAYCCEATLKKIYCNEKFLRRRSPQDLIAELAQVKRSKNITMIHFEDEIFAMDVKWLKDFTVLYINEINLPFTAYIYPMPNVDEILNLLKSAGLSNCCLALESGSEYINREVFGRVYSRELFLETANLCKKLSIDFYTDIITYNPYEKQEDLEKSLGVLTDIGGGFDLCINKLFVLPGTVLAKRMHEENITVGNPQKDRMFDYYCRLYWITSYTRHARFLIGLINKAAIFRRFPRLLNPVLIEVFLSPFSFARSALRNYLPTSMFNTLKTCKARLQLLMR